uniref:Uncharacterized protein n=1 Tax=Fagus sylvatica TaxID=28930 RepID=A0A2N9F1A3_FAGSY
MWRSKDHRSAGLWWSLLSSGGGHGSLGCDFFVSVGAAVDQFVVQSTATSGPCIIFLVISFITHHSWRRRRLFLWLGLVVNRWKTSSCHDYCSFGNLIFALEMFPLQCLEHRAKRGGKMNALMDLQSVRDDIEEATLCIDTSISRVAELVKECRETTGVVSTSTVAFLMVANDSQVMRVVGRVSLRACKMMLSRDTLEKMICQLFEAKVARNFFTIMLIKHIADEVAVESVDNVTADFDDEVRSRCCL